MVEVVFCLIVDERPDSHSFKQLVSLELYPAEFWVLGRSCLTNGRPRVLLVHAPSISSAGLSHAAGYAGTDQPRSTSSGSMETPCVMLVAVRHAAAVVVVMALAGFGGAACGSSTPSVSQGRVVCPSTDRYSCYYSATNAPVHGPKSVAGVRVIGELPKRCTVTGSCRVVSYTGAYHAVCPPTCAAPVPPQEYEIWQVGKSGSGDFVAIYSTNVPKADQPVQSIG